MMDNMKMKNMTALKMRNREEDWVNDDGDSEGHNE